MEVSSHSHTLARPAPIAIEARTQSQTVDARSHGSLRDIVLQSFGLRGRTPVHTDRLPSLVDQREGESMAAEMAEQGPQQVNSFSQRLRMWLKGKGDRVLFNGLRVRMGACRGCARGRCCVAERTQPGHNLAAARLRALARSHPCCCAAES